ncbi:MAG: hypothetical protein PHV17_01735, partial [Candidatus Omnitrophica bacterium]|nr:hypothetical protein [Candidatus Omnitrophota bacterium]
MIDFFDIKIYLYLLGILTVVIIPVYLFLDRKLKPTSLVALVYLLFFYLNKNIAWGLVKPYHDSRRAFANIMIIYKQWFVNGDPIGWNPFLHGGEPLALFSNIFLWAPWNVFCWVSKYLSLPEYTLWNLFLIFLFLNFCTGSFLLFYLLYKELKPALFSLLCLVCSTMFFI